MANGDQTKSCQKMTLEKKRYGQDMGETNTELLIGM